MLDTIYWIIIAALIAISFIGLVYPIIPGMLFLFGAYLLYGICFSFAPLHWLFWAVEILLGILLFFADSVTNLWGVKKYGGSKAGIWGSTIGLLVGPFVIPVAGILIGPFLGAVAGEWLVHRTRLAEAVKIGFGSVIGFLSSIVVKGVIQIIMAVYFFITVL
ncbi:DUF456 domain-containing protein [Heyndrickxia acidiproducens]|uniref:DUF456 domain-containing protein n=1 Tax=Heyndrickxia acidiproducens TaxID=1121084 RepID=UPI000379638C|nr:DUF456 domain-containing protein [Heyndrickxia acidiproducens]